MAIPQSNAYRERMSIVVCLLITVVLSLPSHQLLQFTNGRRHVGMATLPTVIRSSVSTISISVVT